MLKKKVSISLMRVFFGISVKTALALEPQNELVLDFFFWSLKLTMPITAQTPWCV